MQLSGQRRTAAVRRRPAAPAGLAGQNTPVFLATNSQRKFRPETRIWAVIGNCARVWCDQKSSARYF
jgi:hypothetical protein